MKTVAVLAALALALVGCPPNTPPTPPPVPDASDAAVLDALPAPPATDASPPAPTTQCGRACAALALAGCSEGRSVICESRLQTINDARLNPNPARGNLPVTCVDVASVKTAADVRALGQKCNGT